MPTYVIVRMSLQDVGKLIPLGRGLFQFREGTATGPVRVPLFSSVKSAKSFGDVLNHNGYDMGGYVVAQLYSDAAPEFSVVWGPDPFEVLLRLEGALRKPPSPLPPGR